MKNKQKEIKQSDGKEKKKNVISPHISLRFSRLRY